MSNEPTLVVLGASGDLASRLLFPALLSLEHRERLAGLRIIGYARQEWTTDQFHENLRAAIDLGGDEYEGKYLVVASKGGAPQPPSWFVNLTADPHVEVQIKADRFPAVARVATPEEKPAMWAAMTEAWPDYDAYQKKTDREIPVVVLERA